MLKPKTTRILNELICSIARIAIDLYDSNQLPAPEHMKTLCELVNSMDGEQPPGGSSAIGFILPEDGDDE